MALTPDQIKTKEDYFNTDKGGYKKDKFEAGVNQMLTVDYPAPKNRYRLIHDSFQVSLEASYFWILNYLRYDLAYLDVEKITDIFSASEHSAFFGVAQQRLGLQQDKVSQFLATIGKMVKELFQLVREIRILDERLGYYSDITSPEKKISEPAEITLKGIYIDMAEGGAKSPASVYGMARDLQFTTLPDLFFGTNPKNPAQVGEVVDNLQFNTAVKNVLKRKLLSYMKWKEATQKELVSRRTFTVKYLRQHFDIIKMYTAWVKPYLKNIQRMQMDSSKTGTPDLIAAFEGSMVELEFLAKYATKGNKKYKACILCSFDYRTMPQMSYVQEGYQRGPLHVGEVAITLRSYAWTDNDIANYKKMKELEDMELLSVVDGSVKAAMESLGEELQKYLEEAGEQIEKKPEPMKEKQPGINPFEPFVHLGDGFAEILGAFGTDKKGKGKSDEISDLKKGDETKGSESDAKNAMWLIYKNYKKANQMIAW